MVDNLPVVVTGKSIWDMSARLFEWPREEHATQEGE